VNQGEFIILSGASGSGKSTLLNNVFELQCHYSIPPIASIGSTFRTFIKDNNAPINPTKAIGGME
jgi:guanylate kinase